MEEPMTENRNPSDAPRSDQQRALVRQLKRGGEDAGQVFRDLLRQPREQTTEVRLAIRRHPVTALAALKRSSEELGLTERGAADALDEVIAEVDTPERPKHETQRLLRHGLSRDRLRELLHARGDLGSTAALLADARTVIEAMVTDASEDGADQFFTVRAWAEKLRERDDWDTLLARRIPEIENRALRDIILACLYHEAPQAEEGEDDDERDEENVIGGVILSPDTFVSVGIDPDDGRACIRTMLQNGTMPEFSAEEVMRARLRITQRRRRRADAAQTRDVLKATASAKDKVDIG